MFTKILLLAAVLGAASGCSCLFGTPRDRYCRSDWVALVQILAKANVGSQIEYTVKVIVAFKTGGVLSVGAVVKIRTANNSAACGVSGLQIGKLILLSGQVGVGGLLSINICGQVQASEWLQVDLAIRLALLGGTYEPCPCKPLALAVDAAADVKAALK